jgi:hypothetical protein
MLHENNLGGGAYKIAFALSYEKKEKEERYLTKKWEKNSP